MNAEIIKIPAGIEYLAPFLSELPKNVIFDKGKTGCGGTTLAIDKKYNQENYIVAVPFISLAENKAKQFDGDVFSFTGGTTVNELKEYLNTHPVKKIMVTYDSLEKLIKYTGTSDYNLLIDEYHLLFTQYCFRKDAVTKVLNNFRRFDSYTFMTATVLEDEFILEELKEIPIIKAEWDKVLEIEVESLECTRNVKYTVVNLINAFLEGKLEGNAYIFINSVDSMKEVIKICGLTDENTRAIWSIHNNKETGLKRGEVLDEPKKINFLTSTCFEGVDIYDENGRIYIVSDGNKAHTLVDISTSFQQIAGRIRNSKYSSSMTHIFTTTRYVKMGYEEFKQNMEKLIQDTKADINLLNQLSANNRKAYNKDLLYISEKGEQFVFDPNKVKLDLYNYKVTRHLYKHRYTLSQETIKNGYTVKNFVSNTVAEIPKLDDIVIEDGFKDVVKYLKGFSNILSTRRMIAYYNAYEKYPFLQNALDKLGFEGIEKLDYHITNIKRKLITVSSHDEYNKIIKLLNNSSIISVGSFIASDDSKKIFTRIYSELGIKLTPKGSSIRDFYNVKESGTTIKGKRVKGYVLLSRKLISAV